MKTAILGAGNVGGTLGKSFAECGHEIYFGAPNLEKYADENLPERIGAVSQATNETKSILLQYLIMLSIAEATNPLGMTATVEDL
jgi:predicted dinucleotide-binding enzyme